MGKKNLIKIINEEISDFDFLGNDERQDDEVLIQLLSNEDLQKQFICDALLHKEKLNQLDVAEAWLGGDWETPDDNATELRIEYDVKLAYVYDQTKEPVQFNLLFKSDQIGMKMGGWYDPGRFGGTPDTDREPEGEAWFDYIEYNDIDVNLYSVNGDEVQFTAFEKAPPQIQFLFVREFIEPYIRDYTNLEIKERPRYTAQDVPYC